MVKNTWKAMLWLSLLSVTSHLAQAKTDLQQQTQAVNAVLDSLHDAASKAQKQRYLDLFTETGGFMGTDDWERWSRPIELDAYVSERFKDGTGWTYQAVERHLNFSEDGKTAWFDEITESKKWGRFRGTGVVVCEGDYWKIAHYSMSFLVPNEVWEQVSEISNKAYAGRDKE